MRRASAWMSLRVRAEMSDVPFSARETVFIVKPVTAAMSRNVTGEDAALSLPSCAIRSFCTKTVFPHTISLMFARQEFFRLHFLPGGSTMAGAERGKQTMKQIRCGVIGLGWFGEHHVDALQQLPLVDVQAVCTRTGERLRGDQEHVQRPPRLHGLPRAALR